MVNLPYHKRLEGLSLSNFLSKTSFQKLIVIWLCAILFFGLAYNGISLADNYNNYLAQDSSGDITKLEGFGHHLLYSFMTATRFGYKNIVPKGDKMKFLTVAHSMVTYVIFCALLSKIFMRQRAKYLEKTFSLKFSESIQALISDNSAMTSEILQSLSNYGYQHAAGSIDETKITGLQKNTYTLKSLVADETNKEYLKKIPGHNVDLFLESAYSFSSNFNKVLGTDKSILKNARTLESSYAITTNCLDIISEFEKLYPDSKDKFHLVSSSLKRTKSTLLL